MSQSTMLPGQLGPLTPSEYLRLRREAAGLTIRQAAKFHYSRPEHAANCERTLTLMEMPGAILLRDYEVDSIGRGFAFDPAVYRQLRDEPADRHPTICRGCGCTSWSACIGTDGEDCTIDDAGTCTACEQKAQRAPRRAA